MISTAKRTPLYDFHRKAGGRIVEFAGWELPVQYSGVVAEHTAVRQCAGIFDVSHMGEILVSGPEAETLLNFLTCNSVSTLYDGKGQYNALINERGGVVDDIIIYRIAADEFFVCVNAANTEKDFDWMVQHNDTSARIVNRSAEFGQVAIQGPRAVSIAARVLGPGVLNLKPFHFSECEAMGARIIAARTGYTGEDGLELFVPWERTEVIWLACIEAGEREGLMPCGLGARDSLRLEACYPLHGHELGDEISAVESGLGWIVKLDKGNFMGRDVLVRHKEGGAPRSLVGFFLDEPGISRHGDRVYSADGSHEEIGYVTSGTKTPTLNRALGMALVATEQVSLGNKILLDVRGRKLQAHIEKRPFYRRAG